MIPTLTWRVGGGGGGRLQDIDSVHLNVNNDHFGINRFNDCSGSLVRDG